MERIIIVGGGPSGVMAGIFAKRENNEVLVLERNAHPFKKLLMTGSGKCNYFNEVYGTSFYHSHHMDIVEQILTTDNIESVKSFFDSIGLVSKIKNGYYYPFTFQASTMEKLLLQEAERKKVSILTNQFVLKIEKNNNDFHVVTDEEEYFCDRLILACGSKAYPKTGSDGMGYEFLKMFHHTIIPPVPALVQLVGKESFFPIWDGVRAEVEVELFENQQFISREVGEIQLTRYGVSGICIFNLSHFVSRGLLEGKEEVIKINFVPFISTLVSVWMDDYSKKQTYKTMEELLSGFLNPKLVTIILQESHISKNSFYADLTNEQKLILCRNLRSFPITIMDTKGFDSCQICSGGVSLDEINPHTMESLKMKGLYIVGELLDMNGNCGGYNLTTCWISGMLAGKSIGDQND